jgi:hypothetical protein
MVHRGTTRESKGLRKAAISTFESKWRRHRNKRRITQRCLAKLALAAIVA